jgi:hypothetical protein
VPFFVTLAGYLIIFFVEKIAFDTHSFIEEHHHHHHHHHHHGNSDGEKPPAPAAPPAKLGNGGGSGVAVSNSGAFVFPSIHPPVRLSIHPSILPSTFACLPPRPPLPPRPTPPIKLNQSIN